VTLADYSLTPDVAIVDPQFVMSMPKGLTADTGIDCLTHALEAGVSNYASPYTDSNAMQAIRLVFKYLPIAYEHPRDEEARSMMHNAACIAAMAFSNASVGINHALAHAFGARFGVAHGRANALMLPHVIAYNAAVPAKFMPSPYTQGMWQTRSTQRLRTYWAGWEYGGRKSIEADRGHRTVARPIGISAIDRRAGNLEGRV